MLKKIIIAVLSLLFSAIFLVPLLTIFSSWMAPDWSVWQHIQEVLLGKLVVNSFSLVFCVVFLSSFLGISLAACVVFVDIPWSQLITTLLVLPLAMPPYVLGFTLLGITDFGSPTREFLLSFLGQQFDEVLELRNLFGASLSLSLSLFPYVFLLCRQAFLTSGSQVFDAARSLGCSPLACIYRVALPLALPFILSGMSLVALETLADFGTVSMFSFSTFTTGIYKAWFGLFSVAAASQLASLLVLAIAFFLTGKSLAKNIKKQSSFASNSRGSQNHRLLKGPVWRGLAIAWVVLVLTVALIGPCLQLLIWSFESYQDSGWQYGQQNLMASLEVAFSCACVVLVLNLALTVAMRWFPKVSSLRFLSKVSLLGYATPGAVLAVGVIRPLLWVDHKLADLFVLPEDGFATLWFSGTIFTLIFGLSIRFFSIGFSSISNGMKRIPINLEEAARSLGAPAKRIFWKIQLPLLAPSAAVAAVMVFVEAMKEMPLTLMTRPFGWDTLSVRIFELTSEGEWERAAQPSLILTLVGILPVYLLLQGARNVDPS